MTLRAFRPSKVLAKKVTESHTAQNKTMPCLRGSTKSVKNSPVLRQSKALHRCKRDFALAESIPHCARISASGQGCLVFCVLFHCALSCHNRRGSWRGVKY